MAIVAGALLALGYLGLALARPGRGDDKTPSQPVIFTDYRGENPGVVHKITPADLPEPFATPSVDNGPQLVRRPPDAWPKAPKGFKVELYAAGLENPRLIRAAPNGDLFLAESEPGRIKVLRGIDKGGRAEKIEIFAAGLRKPFGIAFYPPGPNPKFLYVGNTDSVVRFPYENGDLKARGPEQVIIPDLPGGGHLRGGGHWTRDIAFSRDGKEMFVSVGSNSNVDDSDNNPIEFHRADILVADPDGSDLRIYARGIRNPVGIAVQPETGDLWASVNERDGLGDNLPPDYITRVHEGGFYGWPWFYIGGHLDPRHKGKHPELKNKVIVPDVLLEPHNASLEMLFYEGAQFPAEYHGDVFAAEHGSWNKAARTGYEVIRVPVKNGRASGSYEDFLTGFVTPTGGVWGRPVGVAVAADGSLMVTDDGSDSVWRVSYSGASK
ncbi:MAG TPA: sorbosone dehydrogenase family protein [Terriglobia bacterium]|nr:sorbosone dehydrogenase family protein [Terriglobia bacterium]